MDASILKNAGINYDHGVKRFLGNERIYEKILKKFLKDTSYERTRADYLAGDTEQLLKDAHELKGVSGNMEMTELFHAADALVSLLRRESYAQEELTASFEALEKAYASVSTALQTAMEDSCEKTSE